MTVCGRRGKPKSGFPRASTVLGNRKSRDSHIPTAAARRGKVENQKQVSHFPTRCFFFPQNESERRPGGGSLRSRLQAHSWIRKCSSQRGLGQSSKRRKLRQRRLCPHRSELPHKLRDTNPARPN